MNNDIKYSMTSLMVLMTLKAQALGLGELVVESDLGEPLSAKIPVIQTRGEFMPADELRISIKADQDILREGINSFLAKETIKLKIEETINDDVVIKLTSSRPMNEPIMNFMLELEWNSGQLIREYNVLLDPPGLGNNVPVVAKQVNTVSNDSVKQSIPRPTRSNTSKTPTPFKNRVYGPVQRGETLSEIAQRVRPGGFNIKLDDMILILVNNNPSAFINNDANLLLQGSLLSVPNGEEILAQLDGKPAAVNVSQTLQLQNELQSLPISIGQQAFNSTNTLEGLRLTTSIDMSRVVNLNVDPMIAAIESTIAPVEETPEIETTPEVAITRPQERVDEIIETEAVSTIEDFDGVVGDTDEQEVTVTDNTIQSDLESIRRELEAYEVAEADEIVPIETAPRVENSDSGKSPIFLILSVLGAVISLVMVVMWWIVRRQRDAGAQAEYRPIPNVARQIPVTKTQATPVVTQPVQTKAPEQAVTIDSTPVETKSEVSDEEFIDTIIMSPEEFKAVGVDTTEQQSDGVLSENEIDYIGTIEDETLINDYLEAVGPSDDQTEDAEDLEDSITEEAIEYANTETEVVMDISVPLDHEDDEVNDIISSLMEAEGDNSHIIDYEPETPVASDDDADTSLDINNYVQTETDDDKQIPLNVDNPEPVDDEVIDLEPDIAEYDLDELVVNFQNTSPEREFEKEVSVFMAYGDFQGAEELIEKALADDANNAVYQMALLSLYKVTGKYGAALELAATLSNKAESLSDENRKKLELLIEDLKADDDSASIAS